MKPATDRVRVLYSFPHKLGAGRICYTAWQQVNGLAAAGADVTVFPGVLHRPVAAGVKVKTTLARGKVRIPYKVLGRIRACQLHDWIVARRLEKMAGQIDVIHLWPLGARRTLETASRLGIRTVLERPNTHTRFGYETVRRESERLGLVLPPGDEHDYNEDLLRMEEEEYRLADRILCPSNFVVKTFMDQGFPREKLLRHIYGYDENRFHPASRPSTRPGGLRMLYVGVGTVVKGLHYALEAWLKSDAHRDGTFQIAGEFLPAYQQKLAPWLEHPSVKVLGQRSDVAELMSASDVLVLPSVTEGFGLVVAEAMGSGCVPLTSDACTDICRHMENGLVHRVGDVAGLAWQISSLNEDRSLLEKLREGALKTAPEVTWTAAGVQLLRAYRESLGR